VNFLRCRNWSSSERKSGLPLRCRMRSICSSSRPQSCRTGSGEPVSLLPSAAPAATTLVEEPKFSESELASLRMPTPFAEWGALHERGLAYMRFKRDEAVGKAPQLRPSAEMASDLRLWRFLVATSFRGADAAKMYVEALQWRIERGMDAVRDALVDANPGFFGGSGGGGGGSSMRLERPHLREVDLLMMEARPRTWYRALESGGVEPLLDKAGNLVYVEVPSAADSAAVCEIKADYLEAELRAQELLQLLIDELSRRAGRMVLIFRVLDLAGFSLAPNLFPSSEVKQGEALVKLAGKEVKDAYPTTTFKNFLVNAPAASIAGPVVAALVPKRSRDKTLIKGADYAPELHRWVDLESLPRKLGGHLEDGLQWVGRKGKK